MIRQNRVALRVGLTEYKQKGGNARAFYRYDKGDKHKTDKHTTTFFIEPTLVAVGEYK